MQGITVPVLLAVISATVVAAQYGGYPGVYGNPSVYQPQPYLYPYGAPLYASPFNVANAQAVNTAPAAGSDKSLQPKAPTVYYAPINPDPYDLSNFFFAQQQIQPQYAPITGR